MPKHQMGEKCRDHEEIFHVRTKLSGKYSLNFARQDQYATCAINQKLIHIFLNHTTQPCWEVYK